MTPLPNWVGDLADVLGIATVVIPSLGWFLNQLTPAAVFHKIVRLDVPVAQDAGVIASSALGLAFTAGLWLWNATRPRPPAHRVLELVDALSGYFVLAFAMGFAIRLVFLTAKLVWKVEHQPRVHGGDGPEGR